LARAFAVKGDAPCVALAFGADDPGADMDVGAAPGSVAGVEDHKAGVFDPSIGIFERLGKAVLEGRAFGRAIQGDGLGARQVFGLGLGVIHGQPQADQPVGALALEPGHDRAEQFRCGGPAFEPHVGRQG